MSILHQGSVNNQILRRCRAQLDTPQRSSLKFLVWLCWVDSIGHFIVNRKQVQRSCEGLSPMMLVATGWEPPKGLSDCLVLYLLSLHDLLSTMQGAMPSVSIRERKTVSCGVNKGLNPASTLAVWTERDDLIAQCLSFSQPNPYTYLRAVLEITWDCIDKVSEILPVIRNI